MMFQKMQEHETAEGSDAGKYMAKDFSVLNLLHYTTLHYTTLHSNSLCFTLHYTTPSCVLNYTTLVLYTILPNPNQPILGEAEQSEGAGVGTL